MVAYTNAARLELGKISRPVIKQEIDSVNSSFKNSLIGHKLELAVLEKAEDIQQNCSRNILEDLIQKEDGILDNLHVLRDKYKVDVVALLVADNDGFWHCGLAGQALKQNGAFIVVNAKCWGGNYSLARQLGYLYGCGNHEKQSGPVWTR